MYTIIVIAMVAIAVLMVSMGVLFLVGATDKNNRHRAFWFLLAMIGCSVWSVMNGVQLIMPADQELWLSWNDYVICVSSLLANIGLLGYCVPSSKARVPILIATLVLGVIVSAIPLFDFQILLDVNQGKTNMFYSFYGLIILLMLMVTIISTVANTRIQNKAQRTGAIVFYIGLVVAAAIIVTFNVIFPFVLHDNSLLWVGSLSLYILMLAFYCNLFMMHKINLEAAWLRVASYIIVICSATMVYATIVFFTAAIIFQDKIPETNISIFAAIISIVLAIVISTVHYLTASLRSVLLVNKIDISFMIDQIKRLPTRGNYKQAATFLASHLHIGYCGLIIDGKLYSSHDLNISPEDIHEITNLPRPEKDIWQKPNLSLSYKMSEFNLTAIAELRTQNGLLVGQVLVGKPNNRLKLGRKDYLIFELIFNILADHLQ